ncbi:hypothetical protein SAMN02799630_03672 [Paenibacillus sp. UNCCL117]|uniref:hypothetical protein n=1 Tax=unclassified Paenibacillus TaxID=185978 RepID=UPI00088E4CF7|nr:MULTISPECIES: hypothetical protein [unclassified Paenibacillus]SDD51337.1 hypothetical protein SAMN04488602_109125 [Paenibacillus sp. cl123]SFW49539.1 hypothetical protein SAMN02799630_03672 [Paenibacillus sp. UNCCL117]
MRKMSLPEIQSKLLRSNPDVNLAVAKFKEKTIEQGWSLSRNRPRSSDEIKALNYMARYTFQEGLRSGAIVYDKEKRVLWVEQYAKS